MNLARLFWKLLRYRVAAMLLLFMVLGAGVHHALQAHPWSLIVIALALACSYVSATSSNDIADEKIDAINHPSSPGRPLISGAAKARDMWRIFFVASVGALGLSAFASWPAAALMAGSILINVLYSLPPARLSYRTFFAPLILGVAYVGIPYGLGVTASGSHFGSNDARWLAGLYLLFVGRIILKDFRDRKGDAQFGKPTFLLCYGKNATCMLSAIGLCLGGGALTWQTREWPWIAGFVAAYTLSIGGMLWRLQRSPVGREEQLSIGVGAKMGNGLLITLLATFALQESGATQSAQIIIAMLLAVAFFGSYIAFVRNPSAAIIGYKG